MEFSASALNGTVRVAMVGRSDCAFAVDGAHQRPANCRDAYTTFATAFTQLLPGVRRVEAVAASSWATRFPGDNDSVIGSVQSNLSHFTATSMVLHPERIEMLPSFIGPIGIGTLTLAHRADLFDEPIVLRAKEIFFPRLLLVALVIQPIIWVTRRRRSLNGRWLLFLLAFSKLLILLTFRGVLVKLFNRLPGTRIRLPEDGLLEAALAGDIGLVTDSHIYLRMLRLSDKPAWRRMLQEGRVRFLVNAREAVSLTPARRVYLGNSILIDLLMPAETCNPQTVPLLSFPRLYVVAYSRFRQRSLPEFFEQASTLTRQDVFRRRPFPKLCLSKPYPEQATWAQVRLIFTVFLGAMGGNGMVLLAEELFVFSAFVRAHAKLMLP